MASNKRSSKSDSESDDDGEEEEEDPSQVYVLSTISVDHANHHRPVHVIVGVYATKAAAVAVAGSVQTEYGSFDDAINELFEEDHIDHRPDPPDDGCLLQLGSRASGEGDFVGLKIQMFPLQGGLLMMTSSSNNNAKKPKAN
eukprot:CAMPEP_0198146592 /NCGR_PEP_ID=MMETSP1443-20131203/30147_1 /TAXON_ID=186043 /ORGANISM="Entomoneis sp., Strain CCMP2396" /LENGTH=141 /DNA_ID=CAMNT_0043810607 /DNA_START=19 /DNA_END=444 /DNA_ORIENTATION=+